MSGDGFDYPRLLARATLGLVRELLDRVAEEGLPGEHHFYLTFLTRAEGVELPASLRVRFPETMTIVVQHQFERLEVDDDGFSVDLRFGGAWERLRIPFVALTSFLDPSVPFGLDFTQFEGPEEEPERAEEGETPPAPRPAPVAGPATGENEDDDGGDSPVGGPAADVLPFRRR